MKYRYRWDTDEDTYNKDVSYASSVSQLNQVVFELKKDLL